MRVRWTDLAVAQLRQVRETSLRTRIRRRIHLLRKFPQSGRVVPELESDDIREVIVGPLRIGYLLRDEEIVIQSVWDARRPLILPDRVSESVSTYAPA